MSKAMQLMGNSLLGILPAMALAVTSLPAQAAVLAPGSTYEGKTLSEWSAQWWEYALSIPVDQTPFLDETGANANIGQSGPVFFLAGTFDGSSVTRTITVSDDKAIFFPLLNTVNISDPSAPQTEEELRAQIAEFIPSVNSLFTSIDGVDIAEAELFQHREVSPAFGVTLPENNVFGVPAGFYEPAVSDGYWLMLTSLTAGEHTISFGGTTNDGGLQNNTYKITVIPVPEPVATVGLLVFGALGVVSGLKHQQKSISNN